MAGRWLRRALRVVLALAIAWALWCALAWWVLPPWLKSQAEQRLGAALERPVTIARVIIDPLRLALAVEDLSVAAAEPGRPPQLRLARLAVDLSGASLWRRASVVERIELDGLRLALVRTGRWNFDVDDLLRHWLAPKAQPGDGSLPRLVLRELQVRDAGLELDDQTSGLRHRIDALTFTLADLSTLPEDAEQPIRAKLALRLDGSAIRIEGQGSPWSSPRRAQWHNEIEPIDLGAWRSDLDPLLPLRLHSARLSAAFTSRISQAAGAAPVLGLQGQVALGDVQWQYPDGGPALSWRDLRVQVAELQPLARRVDIERVEIDGLALALARDSAGQLNLAAAEPREPAAAEPAANNPWRARLGGLTIADARLGWRDETTSPAAAFELTGLTVKLDALRWPLAEAAALRASASLRAGSAEVGRLSVDGNASPREATLGLTLDAFALTALQPYLSAWLVPPVRAGTAAAQGRFDWSAEGGHWRLALDTARIDGLAIGDAGWRKLALHGLAVDGATRQVQISGLRLDQPRLRLARDADRRWNLGNWLRQGAAAAPRAPPPGAVPPWRVRLDRFDLVDGQLDFEDSLAAPAGGGDALALRADALRLHARALRWPLPERSRATPLRASGRLSAPAAAASATGLWTLNGTFTLSPPTFDGSLQLDRLPVAPLLRYAPMPADLRVDGASAGLRLQLALAQSAEGWRVKAEGEAALDDLRLAELTAAPGQAAGTDDLLRWRSLAATGIRVAIAPGMRPALELGEVKLVGLDGKLVLTEQGQLNLATVAAKARGEPQAAPASAPGTADAAPLDIVVGLVRLIDGRVDFEDHFIRPNYRADLSALDGQLGSFRTGSAAMAPLVLGGRVAGNGKLEISGDLNPTAQPLALNLRARTSDIDLPPLSAYSAKYAGYGITDGKLSMDVAYRIDPDGRLQAKHRVVLDQLTFGEAVESESATKLPVRLIVALLKDRNGVIDIELPVEGSVNHPEFRLGPVIIEVLLKKLTRAVASPFTAMAGDGADNLGAIEFVPGTATPVPAAAPTLDKVVQALADRPALTLHVAGSADPEAERDPYRRAVLDSRLAALSGSAAAPAGAERDDLLRQLYRQTALPDKPRNIIGLERDIEPAEMAARLEAAIPASDDALRDLALQRGLVVRAALLSRGLPTEQLFIGTPVLRGAGDADTAWTPRAQLALTPK